MNISCAPQGIVEFKNPKQGIGDMIGAGFEYMLLDLSMACLSGELEKVGKLFSKAVKREKADELYECPERMSDYIKPILEQCKSKCLQCPVAVAPYLNSNTKHNNIINEFLRKLAVESIKIFGQAGGKLLIIQPLFAGISIQNLWECNREYYLDLAVHARQAGVQILLANQCKDYNGHLMRGICSDGVQAAEWIDKLNKLAGEERFGFCMDVGVCNLCGQNMYDFALALGNRIKAVILRDCDGSDESALLPFTAVKKRQSQTDWLNLIRGLREIGFDGELIMNMADTAATFSPILRPELLRMAKAVADYFKWQIELEGLLKKYDKRVLFGAGNMCRNYMKCYGKKYPPLFTCDNNRNIWETEFCGLAVQNPEILKNLPKDCAIFICNIYYREIEAQLRQMGLQNPIEYFNDEYMPTFYFDRLADRER